ncbi:hypothetical protein FACS189487_10970 [Campylobacterota bacterium]|nr:hypothetical protein FACS189487_10970 [Campylobacterota bacterium]
MLVFMLSASLFARAETFELEIIDVFLPTISDEENDKLLLELQKPDFLKQIKIKGEYLSDKEAEKLKRNCDLNTDSYADVIECIFIRKQIDANKAADAKILSVKDKKIRFSLPDSQKAKYEVSLQKIIITVSGKTAAKYIYTKDRGKFVMETEENFIDECEATMPKGWGFCTTYMEFHTDNIELMVDSQIRYKVSSVNKTNDIVADKEPVTSGKFGEIDKRAIIYRPIYWHLRDSWKTSPKKILTFPKEARFFGKLQQTKGLYFKNGEIELLLLYHDAEENNETYSFAHSSSSSFIHVWIMRGGSLYTVYEYQAIGFSGYDSFSIDLGGEYHEAYSNQMPQDDYYIEGGKFILPEGYGYVKPTNENKERISYFKYLSKLSKEELEQEFRVYRKIVEESTTFKDAKPTSAGGKCCGGS